jgi:hypothetical protein
MTGLEVLAISNVECRNRIWRGGTELLAAAFSTRTDNLSIVFSLLLFLAAYSIPQ